MILDWIIINWSDLVALVPLIVGIASIIVKLTPTVADDIWLKKVLKFLGNYVALNKEITEEEQLSANLAYLERQKRKV